MYWKGIFLQVTETALTDTNKMKFKRNILDKIIVIMGKSLFFSDICYYNKMPQTWKEKRCFSWFIDLEVPVHDQLTS
jgi:hypothetical protein